MPNRNYLIIGLVFFCLSTFGCAAKHSQPSYLNTKNNTPIVVTVNTRGGNSIAPAKNKNTALNVKSLDAGELALVKPADGPIRSPYGMRRHPILKKNKFHKGIDIAAERGSEVLAAAPGVVTFSGTKGAYGKTIEIEHADGIKTLYAHLDKILVSKGQRVDSATRIGSVGRSGRATGPNLHFELIARGKPINPVPKNGWIDPDSLSPSLASKNDKRGLRQG